MVEATAVRAHEVVQLALARVAEGGMADVVDQGEGFGKLTIQIQRGGDGASDLSDFNGVGEAITKMVREAHGKDLGF
ncbi:MAG: hypothetical protein NVS9B4_10520 [Candidatus Acidiferrum sp.]